MRGGRVFFVGLLVSVIVAAGLPTTRSQVLAAVPPSDKTVTPAFPPNDPAAPTPITWEACGAFGGLTPTSTIYLPNITKTLGGPGGWVTPFFIQNTGKRYTDVVVSFYRFSDGSLVTCRTTRNLSPGEIVADDPNDDLDLPDDTQFAVVVQSYGAQVTAVVNQKQGSGAKTQALSYSGFATGATTVFLPNVTRRFFGYDVPFIIQNMGAGAASVTASFVSFDGSQRFTTTLQIAPGRSGVIDPDFTPGLIDGTQYAVTLRSSQPVGVVVNAHNEALGPVAFSHNGLAHAGAGTTLWAPYAMKSGPNGIFSPIVVQNVSTATLDATLEFTPLETGGATQTFVLTGIAAGGSRAFDPRFALGTIAPCAAASATCLGPGEYSLKITAPDSVAAVVLPNSNTTAAAYLANSTPNSRAYLPIVQRRSEGWTGSIYLQSTSSTSVNVRYHSVADYNIDATQSFTLTPGVTKKIDPRLVAGLREDHEYGVIAESSSGAITAIVFEEGTGGGDASMIYEGLALPPLTGPFIRGVVRGPAGPASGVNVRISAGGFIVNSGITDLAGQYAIPVPANSVFIVHFRTPDSGRLVQEVYEDAASFTENKFVVVDTQDVTVDATLASALVLSGRVTAQSGGAVPGATVHAFRADCVGCSTIYSGRADAAGAYRLLVPAGSYKIRFFPPEGSPYIDSWYPGATSFAAASAINVSGDVPNLNGTLRPAFRITGTVRDASGRGVPGVVARVRVGGGATCCTTTDTALTDLLGRYTAIVPSGSYRVSFIPPGQSGLATTWYGNATSFLTSPDVVVSGGDVVNIDGVAARGGTLAGDTTYQGVVVTGVSVQIYLANAPCCNNVVALVASDVSGTYWVSLPAGTYRVRFFSGSADKWFGGSTSFSGAQDVPVSVGVLAVIEVDLP